MKKILILICLIISLTATISSAMTHQVITVGATAVGLSITTTQQYLGMLRPMNSCYCTVETTAIRLFWDGTAPTSAVGHLIAASTSFNLQNRDELTGLQMISTGSNATVTCTCEP